MKPADFFPSRFDIVTVISFSFLVCWTCCFLIGYFPVFAVADFNFAAVGDWGCGVYTDSTVSSIVARNPELVLGLGDYSYYPTGTCWFNKISPIDDITKISIGNHDNDSFEGFSGYMSHFGLSQTYYSFNHQNVHFLVMDTDRNSHLKGSDQYDFVLNDLRAASQDPNIEWIITYFHKPIYTSKSEHSAIPSLRDLYHPIFEKYGVDLVLSGHNHNYQRTFPLKYNLNDPQNPVITSRNANEYSDPVDPIFAIVGTGGINFHPLSNKASFVSSQQDNFFGHLDVKITNNGTKLEGRFYRNSGQIDDTFSIRKGTALTLPVTNNHNITVTNNTPPIAVSQAITLNKNNITSITLKATDPSSDSLKYIIVTGPKNGTLSEIDNTPPKLIYHPDTNYVGDDSFTFRANDGIADSNRGTVSITVLDPEDELYQYAPGLVLTGSNYHDEPSSPSLQLSKFSIAAWFKTSTEYASNAYIVNKGGTGSENAGQNQNYGLWMTNTGRIRAGFETSTGANELVTSVNAYNDGQWHYAVVTYDGSSLVLYIDAVRIDSIDTSGASPDTSGKYPVRIGANSRVTTANYFVGDLDEVRIWDGALSDQDVEDSFRGISFNTIRQVLYLKFDP